MTIRSRLGKFKSILNLTLRNFFYKIFSPEKQTGSVGHYFLAAILVGIALIIRLLIAPIEAGLPFLTFFPAATISAIIGGFGPGLFAVLMCMSIATILFFPPYSSFSLVFSSTTTWSNMVYFIDMFIVCSVVEIMHRHSIKYFETIASLRTEKASKEAILEEDKKLRAFAENTPVPIAMLDKNMYYIACSRRWITELGIEAPEIIGKKHNQVLPELSEHWNKNYSLCVAGLPQSSEDDPLIRPDGSVMRLRWKMQPWYENDLNIGGIVVWIEDITELKRIEEKRLALEAEHRNVLVKEVHHRIKNNLQGITGMLRQFAAKNPETLELINEAISQVQSIAVIHGIQGRASLSTIHPCELITAIASGIESLWHKTVLVDMPSGCIGCIINEPEAVPLALILNELISNAVKHSQGNDAIRITLTKKGHSDSIELAIYNRGKLPANFDIEQLKTRSTGLNLVASLLPYRGAKLSWQQQESFVLTLLELGPPVILQTTTKD